MQKAQLLDAVLEQQEVVHKDGWNVATSQRRDVSASFSSQSLKGKWERNSRGSEIGNRTNQGAEIRAE